MVARDAATTAQPVVMVRRCAGYAGGIVMTAARRADAQEGVCGKRDMAVGLAGSTCLVLAGARISSEGEDAKAGRLWGDA